MEKTTKIDNEGYYQFGICSDRLFFLQIVQIFKGCKSPQPPHPRFEDRKWYGRTVGRFQESAFGQIFLLCPTDGRAEPNCPKISRLSAWLSSTFSDKFGQSNNRIPKTLGAFLGQINVC